MFKAANVTVMVSDINRALDFYTNVLGLPAGMRHGNNYAEVKAPGVTIVLHPKGDNEPKASPKGNLSIGFQVADVKKATENMKQKGLSFKFQENEANTFAFFSDPDGTPLYFIEMK